jgi:hypothetical protein
MDGNDVTPPGPPRYGDLRLHLDPAEVQAFAELRERQDEAIRAVQLKREAKKAGAEPPLPPPEKQERVHVGSDTGVPSSLQPPPEGMKGDPTEVECHQPNEDDGTEDAAGVVVEPDYEVLQSYDDGYERRVDPVTGELVRYLVSDRPVEEDWSKIRFGAGIGAAHRSMSAKDREAEFARWQTSLLGRIPDQPTFVDVGTEYRVFDLEARRKRAREAKKCIGDGAAAKAADDENSSDERDADADNDYVPVSKGDKQLGDGEGAADDTDNQIPKMGGGDDSGEDDTIDGASDESEADGKKQQAEEDDNDDEGKNEVDDTAEQPAKASALKKVKPITLSAVPSFYEQDLKRIKLIHHELIAASAHESARRRSEEVTQAYNAGKTLAFRSSASSLDLFPIVVYLAFAIAWVLTTYCFRLALRRSVELSNRRDHFESQLQKLHYQARNLDPREGGISAAENWSRAKQHYENEELNRLIKSRWGHQPDGTTATKLYGRRPDPVSQLVAHCLADVVDAVEMVSTGQARPMQTYPIPFPRGGSHFEALQNVEAQVRKDLAIINAKLRTSEEERQKAWRKMMKTKAECESPHPSSRGRLQVTIHNYHSIPMPVLRASGLENVSDEFAVPRPSVASYVPQRSRPVVAPSAGAAAAYHSHAHDAHQPSASSSSSRHPSESRYSTARVKERIGHDGTVAPVSEPKKSKDGLYLRPAGRTRKGMEWDAVRGIWVPSASGHHGSGE